ncbi:hypothetical protein ES706_06300 [subsurface metagenome]
MKRIIEKDLTDSQSHKIFALILIYAIASRLYFIFRYGGHWLCSDTSVFTRIISSVSDSGQIFSEGTRLYAHGFGYPVTASIHSFIAGVPIQTYQQYLHPILGVIPILLAYPFFLRVIKSKKIALLSTFLLASIPEVLFETSRGTHATFTYTMIILSAYVLAVIIDSGVGYRKSLAMWVILCLSLFALISFNVMMAVVFILAIIVSFAIGSIFYGRLKKFVVPSHLFLSSILGVALLALMMFCIYPPAAGVIGFITRTGGAITQLVPEIVTPEPGAVTLEPSPVTPEPGAVTLEPSPVTPQLTVPSSYQYVQEAWRSVPTYLFLTLANWVVGLLSLICWGVAIYLLIVRKKEYHPSLLLLLSLYTGLGLVLATSLLSDWMGRSAMNLELRVFPLFMIFSAPLAGILVSKIINYTKRGKLKVASLTILSILIVLFAVNAPLKATSEPSLCRHWHFYSVTEESGVRWLSASGETIAMWKGAEPEGWENRLSNLKAFLGYYNIHGVPGEKANYVLISDIIRRRSGVVNIPIPDISASSKIYAAGDVAIYNKVSSK